MLALPVISVKIPFKVFITRERSFAGADDAISVTSLTGLLLFYFLGFGSFRPLCWVLVISCPWLGGRFASL